MHADTILRRTLDSVLGSMHARRRAVLLQTVEALVAGRRLTLTDLARSWPGAEWMHAPLKAVDRLLSNPHLHQAVAPLHQAMARWLLRGPHPLVLVDWSVLKHDGRWVLLRAATPVGGRALTIYEQIYPASQINSPRAQRAFLDALAPLLPTGSVPVLVTDAGFRSDWFRAVAKHGWDYIGRVRHNTHVRRAADTAWIPCKHLFEGARRAAENLGLCDLVKGDPWRCRLVRVRRANKHRHAPATRKGTPAKGTVNRKARKSASDPWLLVTSLSTRAATPATVVAWYAARMQIEEAFRDLKSHRYGMGFEDSLTRSAPRLTVLLLLHALATFAAWCLARALEHVSMACDPLTAQPAHRSRYSSIRRALEWLRRPGLDPGLAKAWVAFIGQTP